MERRVERDDFEDIIRAAKTLLSEDHSSPEPEGASDNIDLMTSARETEPSIGSAADAQAAIREKLQEEYGERVAVNVLKTSLESDRSDGSSLWLVEGDAELKKGLFRRKRWHFTYFLDAAEGKIRIVRSSKG